jgi:hypothetical protein
MDRWEVFAPPRLYVLMPLTAVIAHPWLGRRIETHWSGQFDRAVVVAVIAVRVVQVAVHQVVNVVAVRDRLVPAAWAVDMPRLVAVTFVPRGAGRGVARAHRDDVLLHHAVRGLVVQVAVVQEIGVPVVLDCGVPAAGAVLVGVVGVNVCHVNHSFL